MRHLQRFSRLTKMAIDYTDPRTFPRPPALESTSRLLEIRWPATSTSPSTIPPSKPDSQSAETPQSAPTDSTKKGELIASTTSAYMVLETYHPPTYYIPKNDIRATLRKHTSPSSICEWKGAAVYYDVLGPTSLSKSGEDTDGDSEYPQIQENEKDSGESSYVKARAWSYDTPTHRFRDLKDCISFYADSSWECFVDGEKVEAQPGDFYGGWMTGDVKRDSVKGAPGTRHW